MIFMFSYDRNILPNSFQDYFLQNSERGLNPGLRNANESDLNFLEDSLFPIIQ